MPRSRSAPERLLDFRKTWLRPRPLARAGQRPGRCQCAEFWHCSRSASDSRRRCSPRRRKSRRTSTPRRLVSTKRRPARPLTKVSQAPPGDVVAQFLRSKGASAAAVASLKTVSEKRSARTGITHVRMEQYAGGLRVERAYLKAAVNGRGELVHVIDALARVSGRPSPASITEAQALHAALAALHPEQPSPALLVRQGNIAAFEKGSFFHKAPTVERVAIPMKGGSLQTGFLVTTWTEKGNLLHETLVSGRGAVLSTELRTNTDSYNIFPEHPDETAQTVVAGRETAMPSRPSAGLRVPRLSINIRATTSHAYLDTDANNKPDGGSASHDGHFRPTPNLGARRARPTTARSRCRTSSISTTSSTTSCTGRLQRVRGQLPGEQLRPRRRRQRLRQRRGAGRRRHRTTRTSRRQPTAQNPRMQMYLWTGKRTHQVRGRRVDLSRRRARRSVRRSTTTGKTGHARASPRRTAAPACCDLPRHAHRQDRGHRPRHLRLHRQGEERPARGRHRRHHRQQRRATAIMTMGGTDGTITIPRCSSARPTARRSRPLPARNATIRLTTRRRCSATATSTPTSSSTSTATA